MADETGAVAAQVANEAPGAPVAQGPSLAEAQANAKAKALGAAPATPGVGDQAVAPVDPWEVKAPPVKISSARDRILAKQSAQQAAQQSQTLQAQFDQVQARLTEMTGAEQRAMAEFQANLDKGDVEGALKVKGLPVSFEDLQRAKLKAMGAISDTPKDPRVDAMEAELRALKEEKQKQQDAIRQRQEQAAQQREWQEGVAQVKAEIEALELPGAKHLTGLHGFNDSVLAIMMKNPEASIEQAAAVVRRDYQALYTNLREAFEQPSQQAAAPMAPATTQRQTPAQAVASRRAAAPAPLGAIPSNISLKERAAAAKARAMRG